MTYSPDGKTLASGSWDGGIRLWDARTGEHIRTLKAPDDWVNQLGIQPGRKDARQWRLVRYGGSLESGQR